MILELQFISQKLSHVISNHNRNQALASSTVVFFQKLDVMAIPRAVYAAFIALFVIIAVVAYIVDHFLMANIAKAGEIKKTYTF